jgi:transcriptional regulator with XRE-family HTH domain
MIGVILVFVKNSLRQLYFTFMNTEFREAVSSALREALQQKGLEVARAATELRVSRQIMHKYLKGTALPSIEVLYRACEVWQLRISYRGVEFGACSVTGGTDYGKRDVEVQNRQASFSFESVKSRDFSVKVVGRSERGVELQLALRVGS